MKNVRSLLATAIGFGSAKGGVGLRGRSVFQRSLPSLTLWFAASIIAHTGSDYATLVVWLRTPRAAILMILLLIALFYHTALGLQVVIEDYVHSATKFAAVIAVRIGCCGAATAGVVASCALPSAVERNDARVQKTQQ